MTSASGHDEGMPREGVLDPSNTASGVWADSAYRSRATEAFMQERGFTSHVHHRKPKGRPMAKHIRGGTATRYSRRAPIEHGFAVQKHIRKLTVRTIGMELGRTKIGKANIAYNIRRLAQIEGKITA